MRNHIFGMLCFLSFSQQIWAVCPGDLDGSGTVEVADVLSLLSTFGCVQDCGQADLNNDGIVGVDDVLEIWDDWNVVNLERDT